MPITLKVVVSPMLYTPQMTDRKIIGPATAFKKPRNLAKSGETTSSRIRVLASVGIIFMKKPRITALTTAISSLSHSGLRVLYKVNRMRLLP